MTGPAVHAPGGIIYEPGERVLAVGRPFAWWVLFAGLEVVFFIVAALAASQSQQVSVANPTVPPGSTITFHLFLPAGAPIKSVQAFVQESAATSWRPALRPLAQRPAVFG